jgi:uncharacterized protein YggE
MNPIARKALWMALAAWLVPAAAVAQRAPAQGGILMVAHPAPAEPETVRIELVVEGAATSATGARVASELAAQRVVRALSGTGIGVRELRVAGTTVLPEFERSGPLRVNTIREAPRPVGYRAFTAITLRTDEPSRAGLLLDLARGAGATPLRAVSDADPVPGAPR